MRISYNWLADLVEQLPPVPELAELLTHAGLEVEAIERQGEGLDRVVVGEVLEKLPVEGSDKLHLCKVEAGEGAPLSIVCGAANYEVGAKVPTALVGATLPGGMRIEARKLRGVDSAGMLCSAKEMGIAEDASGLLLLDPSLRPGTPIREALGLNDVVLTLNATPNRPDWLSHLGVARELVALTGTRLKPQPATPKESGEAAASLIAIRLEAPEACSRYAARVVEGLRFGESPAWMRARLELCGVRALGNLIDVTNYVLLETGHPLHAFDLDEITERTIVVRKATEGERLVTLDEKERSLAADDLVIADPSRPLVLAGVMGGADAEVGEGTTRVVIESAWFDPASVRRSSKRHGLHTESSHRFERGADIGAVTHALDRAAWLLESIAGGQVRPGIVDVYPEPQAPQTVGLRFGRVGDLLGTPVDSDESRRILRALEFRLHEEEDAARAGGDGGDGKGSAGSAAPAARPGDRILVEVPSFRVDVSREVDLIEEIARIRGYGSIPAALPSASAAPALRSRDEIVLSRIQSALAAAGLDEVIHLSFGDPRDFQSLDPEATRLLPLKNPLAETLAVMRPTLLAGLLRNAAFNLNRQAERLRIYEQGKVFLPVPHSQQPVEERWHLAGLLLGSREPASWLQQPAPVDFYDAKGTVTAALESVGIEAEWEPHDAPCLHPRSAARIRVGGRILGQLGEVHPKVAEAFDLPRGIFVFELAMERIVEASRLLPSYHGVPRFPAVLRDLAVVVPADVPSERLRSILLGPAGSGLVEGVELFDVYQGPQLGENRKSLAFAIRYRAADRTLKDDEIQQVHNALVGALGREVGAELRG